MKHTLTDANMLVLERARKLLNKTPGATLQMLADSCKMTIGSLSWNLRALKLAKYIKRDKQTGHLIVLK